VKILPQAGRRNVGDRTDKPCGSEQKFWKFVDRKDIENDYR
jgi:hypothetical protein